MSAQGEWARLEGLAASSAQSRWRVSTRETSSNVWLEHALHVRGVTDPCWPLRLHSLNDGAYHVHVEH